MDEGRKRIHEVAKKVAQLLAENQVTLFEVSRVFHEVNKYLAVSYRED